MGMFDFLWNKKEKDRSSLPSRIEKQDKPWQTIPHHSDSKIKIRDELLALVNGRGHKDFFCLHNLYSPGSRIPAIDFSPWIIEKLEKGDQEALRILLWELVRGNPGLSISVGDEEDEPNFMKSWWLSDMDKIMDADLSNYIIADEKVLNEIRTFMFLGLIQEGLHMSKLAFKLSEILIPWKIGFKNFELLIDRANRFIKKMREDENCWKDLTFYKIDNFPNPAREEFSLFNKILSGLPLITRLHFFDVCGYTQYGKGPVKKTLDDMTFFPTRQMGIDTNESAQILLKSGLVNEFKDQSLLLSMRTKEELTSMLNNEGLPFKKSWKKAAFIDAVMKGCGKSIKELEDKTYFGKLNSDFIKTAWKSWKYAESMVDYYRILLGFIIPDKAKKDET